VNCEVFLLLLKGSLFRRVQNTFSTPAPRPIGYRAFAPLQSNVDVTEAAAPLPDDPPARYTSSAEKMVKKKEENISAILERKEKY